MTSGFFHFFNTNAQRVRSRASASKKNRTGRDHISMKPRRLITETLEERQLLAVDVLGAAVLNASVEEANVITISKQEISIDAIKTAIEEAAKTPENDVIKIAAGSLKFESATDEITINIDEESYGSVTIVAEGGDLNIDANGLARAFTVKNGCLRLESVNIANGKSDYGGAIANGGTLVLIDAELTNNEATVSGGAIANKGVALVQNSIIEGNTATVDGAAIYEGDFAWPAEATPEWSDIPNFTGDKGQTLEIDLSQYCSEGAWTYGFDASNIDSAIFAEKPTLENGVLTLKFIDNADYNPEKDYSAVTFEVSASDGTTTEKTSFNVAHKCQTSAVFQATFTTKKAADIKKTYKQSWWMDGVDPEDGDDPTTVYVASNPVSEEVDLSTASNLFVELWLKDLAREKYEVVGYNEDDEEILEGKVVGYDGENVWDSYEHDDFLVQGVTFYLTLENATLDLTFDENLQCRTSTLLLADSVMGYVEDCTEEGSSVHLYKVDCPMSADTKVPCGQYALLGYLKVKAEDATQPIAASLAQCSVDSSCPTLIRAFSGGYSNVDPSQILFVGCVSNSSEPTSEIPGRPFESALATFGAPDTAFAAPLSAQADDAAPELYIANSLIVGNNASGVGVINVAEGEAYVCNTTIADNVANGAALYAGQDADVEIANSIVVNGGLASATTNVEGRNNLVEGSVAGSANVLYDSAKPLFNNGEYTLAPGSQALNIGADEYAQDFVATAESQEEFVALTTDLAGNPRFSATVDAGAYEYQGTAPNAPTNVVVSDYVDSAKKPTISWKAPSAVDGVEGYYVYYGENKQTTSATSFDVTKLTTLADDSTYEFRVSAFNAYGESSAVTVTLDTLVAPNAPTGLTFGEYANGSATLTWTTVSNASYYQIKDAEGKVVADNIVEGSYTLTGLVDFSTYAFTVVAVNAKGSVASEAISLDTTVAPAVPTGFKAGAKYADSALTLNWDSVEHADGYVVYQKVDGEWSAISDQNGTSFTVSNLEDFTTYEFAVASYARKGDLKLISGTATLTAYTAVKPDAPANFKEASEYASGSITVQWDAVVNADGYLLAKKEASGWSVVATTTDVSYAINGLADNAEYVYGVASYSLDDDGAKLQSDFTSLTINTVVAPVAPTNVKFAEYSGGTSATLTWSAVSGVSGYYVEAQNEQGAWELVDTTTDAVIEVTVEENSYYVYRVASFNTVGDVTKASEYVEATLDTLVPPTGELNLAVVDYSFVTATAELTWDKLDAASYYVVEVKVGQGDWTTVEQKYESNSYSLTALQPNASYSFRVTAANAAGKGVDKTVDFFTSAPPAKPSVTYSYDKDAKTATISYSSEVATEYRVYESGELVYEGAATSYKATGLVDNESYTFTIIAHNEKGDSEPVEITFIASAAPQAPVVTISSYADHAATLSWTSVEFADGYRVYQQNGNAWVQVGSDLGVDASEYELTNLQDYANYKFAVVAFNGQGESPYSGAVSLDTTVAPNAPTGLQFASEYAGDGKATLVWDAVEHAVGYTIKYVLDGEQKSVVVQANSFDVEGLANYENYTFTVEAFANRGEEKLYSQSASISLDTKLVPTDEFKNVAVSTYDYVDDVATLSWDAVAHATGYKITLIEVGVSTITYETTENSYLFSLKDNAQYTYTIVAYNEKGEGSTFSNEFFTFAPPEKPTAWFTAYDPETRQATLTWNAVEHATSYKVQVYDDEKQDWVDVELPDPQLTYYVVTDMIDFESYAYRVAASNKTGDSDWYEASITATTTPLAPYDLVYTYSGKTKIAQISWSDDLNPSDVGYKVYQWNDDTDAWDFKANYAHLSKLYISNPLELYSEYLFAVTSWVKDESGHVLESAKEDATILISTNWTPGNIEEAYFVDPENYNGDGTAKLVWSKADGAAWYEIYDGEKNLIATTTENSFEFKDDYALANYAIYDFVIVAVNDYKGEGEEGRGGYSEEIAVRFSTMLPPTQEFTVNPGNYDYVADSLKLTWDKVDFADGYRVFLTQDGEEAFVGTTDKPEYTFTNLTDNAEYSVRVVAYNEKGDGVQSVGDFFTVAPPKAPENVAFGEYYSETHKATLSWTGDVYALGYAIQVWDGADWQDVVKSWKTNSYTVEDLVDDSTYLYRVCAYNDTGYSDYVEATLDTSVKTAPKAPSDLAVAYDSKNDRATLTWSDNSNNENGFVLQRSYDNVSWSELATVDANVASYDLGELNVGVTYYFRVASTNAYGNSEWDVVSYAIPAPNAPSDLVVGTYDGLTYSVDLSWVDNSTDEQGFKIEWSNDQTTWYADYVGSNDDSEVVAYRKTKLVEGRTYYFRVSAYNKAGSSDYATAYFDVPAIERQKPNAPSDVQLVDYDEEARSITMKWTDNSEDEEKFVVQFSYDHENWYSVANVDHDVDSLNVEGLVEGRVYYLRVAAYNSAGYSDWSEGSYSVATRVLDAPTDFKVDKLSNSSVQLSWTDNSNFEDGYLLQYSYDGVNWSRVGYLEADANTCEFDVVAGRSYYFRVAAYYGNTTSDWLSSEKYEAPVDKPAAPDGLTVKETKNGVTLTWNDRSNNEVGFNVEYSLDGGATWIASGKTAVDVTTKNVSNLRVGANYKFRVRAYNTYGRSEWVTESYTFVNMSAPIGPTSLTLGEYDSGSNSIGLTWGYGDGVEEPDVYGYRLQYSYDGGNAWYSAGTTRKGDLDSVVSGLVGGRTYVFRVASYNADGASAWIESESVNIPLSDFAPEAPTDLACEYDKVAKSVKLTWTDNSNVEKGYKVEYSVDGEHWSDYAYLEANSTQREITGLDAGETYYFNVVAYNAYGESSADAVAQITIDETSEVAKPEISLIDYKASRRQITLNWLGNAASYNVQYRYCWTEDSGEPGYSAWYSLANGTVANEATLKNVTAGVKYDFRVQAVGEKGALSGWSKIESYDTGSMTSTLDDVVLTTGADYFEELESDSIDAIAASLL